MACSRRTVSGCLRSHHYPTRSPVVINDNRLEYWFVNLQSGAIRCRLQNYMILTNAGRVCICVHVKILAGSKLLLQLFCQNIPTTAVVEWWMPNLGVVYMQSGWCWNRGCSWGELAWYVRSYALTHSVSQDIRSDWWFVMVKGQRAFHSHTRHPAPSRLCSPVCFSAALQGNQDNDTLWARGRQLDLHTKPGRGIYLICLQSLNLSAWARKFKGTKFEYI